MSQVLAPPLGSGPCFWSGRHRCFRERAREALVRLGKIYFVRVWQRVLISSCSDLEKLRRIGSERCCSSHQYSSTYDPGYFVAQRDDRGTYRRRVRTLQDMQPSTWPPLSPRGPNCWRLLARDHLSQWPTWIDPHTSCRLDQVLSA